MKKRLRQEDLALKFKLSKSAIGMYERDEREPSIELIHKFADFFNVSVDYLLGRTDDPKSILPPDTIPIDPNHNNDILKKLGATPLGKTVPIPVLGVIRAGEPIFAQENIIEHQEVPEDDVRGGEYFFLIVTGDSMVGAGILPGSRVLVRRQDYVDDGAIAVVLVGEEATIKRIKHVDGKVLLVPANPMYEPQVYNEDEVKIIGKVVRTIIEHE